MAIHSVFFSILAHSAVQSFILSLCHQNPQSQLKQHQDEQDLIELWQKSCYPTLFFLILFLSPVCCGFTSTQEQFKIIGYNKKVCHLFLHRSPSIQNLQRGCSVTWLWRRSWIGGRAPTRQGRWLRREQRMRTNFASIFIDSCVTFQKPGFEQRVKERRHKEKKQSVWVCGGESQLVHWLAYRHTQSTRWKNRHVFFAYFHFSDAPIWIGIQTSNERQQQPQRRNFNEEDEEKEQKSRSRSNKSS